MVEKTRWHRDCQAQATASVVIPDAEAVAFDAAKNCFHVLWYPMEVAASHIRKRSHDTLVSSSRVTSSSCAARKPRARCVAPPRCPFRHESDISVGDRGFGGPSGDEWSAPGRASSEAPSDEPMPSIRMRETLVGSSLAAGGAEVGTLAGLALHSEGAL
eukprot:CAMPEP_0206423012 /NCGR_PEP_ID=MMETSP0324_2-20121206/2437_1 /ASSEMBLY_ACC=CAM_ASM_000836 /TAXON_ID=2866 /ORGANISM="Crypthecodinium cohnii, Strain Seligo" /LENGTH=158 /DNA_ID=CAMNT_0053887511 /DNA_START=412 /DNA_END=884 /DNA_ORIENTATION=-